MRLTLLIAGIESISDINAPMHKRHGGTRRVCACAEIYATRLAEGGSTFLPFRIPARFNAKIASCDRALNLKFHRNMFHLNPSEE